MPSPLFSIVITNYNYGRFLDSCLQGALAQTYPNVEIIVVDDGSTDESRDVLKKYEARVRILLKENGGQASGINQGFAMSRGELVMFLDSDDLLFPTALQSAADAFAASNDVVRVGWPLAVVDGNGDFTGQLRPTGKLADGDLRHLLATPHIDHSIPPQSGNAWTRAFLARALPIDEQIYRTGGADTYLSILSIPYGRVAALPTPQGGYRIHGSSAWTGLDFGRRLALEHARFERTCRDLGRCCLAMGMQVDADQWFEASWVHRTKLLVERLGEVVPAGCRVLLVDEDSLGIGSDLHGFQCAPFPADAGRYAGAPESGDAALEAFHQASASADFIAFAWPAFWWLDYYTPLALHLRDRYPCVTEDAQVMVYDLRLPERASERA